MAEPTDAAPWTIKNVPVEIRQKAIKAANADGQTVAQFLAEAVTLLIDKRAGVVVMPAPSAAVLSPDQLTQRMMAVAAMQQSTAALKQTTGRATGRSTLQRCLASLEFNLINAEGQHRGASSHPFGKTFKLEGRATPALVPSAFEAD